MRADFALLSDPYWQESAGRKPTRNEREKNSHCRILKTSLNKRIHQPANDQVFGLESHLLVSSLRSFANAPSAVFQQPSTSTQDRQEQPLQMIGEEVG